MLEWKLKEGQSFDVPEWVDRITVVDIGREGVKVRFEETDPLGTKLEAKAARKLDRAPDKS